MTTRHRVYSPTMVTRWSRRLRIFDERIERGRPKDTVNPRNFLVAS
jgi:hypothetical protein